MKIGIVAPIVESIPPEKYGGTERVIYYLVEGLVKKGHDVTMFASGDSKTSAHLVPTVPVSLRKTKTKDIYGFNTRSMLNIGIAYDRQDEFDVIHDHNPHLSLPTANIAKVPVVVTWHGPFDEEIINLFSKLKKPNVVSISKSQSRPAPNVNFLGTVYNGLDMSSYPFNGKPKDYLLYVGRIDPQKGTDTAIDAAVALGKKLIIAAKAELNIPHIKRYFNIKIKPKLDAHPDLIEWVGEVEEEQRNELMKNALCMLHPITWPEPFGLTLIEAMACGCPVIAYNLGSMQEIIINGKTGFIVDNFNQLLEAIHNIGKINREDCRRHSLQNFSADRMVEGYLNMYEKAIALKNATFNEKADESRKHKRQRLFLEFSPGNN